MKTTNSLLMITLFLLGKPLYSMNFFTNLFEHDDEFIEEKIEEELIEKTDTPKNLLIDLSTLYQPNEKIARDKIATLISNQLDISCESFVFGIKKLSEYLLSSKSVGEEEKTKLFEFLETIDTPSEFTTINKKVHTHHNNGESRALPLIFSTFFLLQDEQKEKQLRIYIKNELEKTDHTSSLKKILSASIDIMFNSNEINEIMELNNDMYTMAKKCKESGHNLILTGNIPTHAFENFIQLAKGYPLKELFDEKKRFISGKLQLLTPQKEFYEIILKNCDAKPINWITINEHKKNMLAALCLQATIIRFKTFDKKKEILDKFNEKLKNALISQQKTTE